MHTNRNFFYLSSSTLFPRESVSCDDVMKSLWVEIRKSDSSAMNREGGASKTHF